MTKIRFFITFIFLTYCRVVVKQDHYEYDTLVELRKHRFVGCCRCEIHRYVAAPPTSLEFLQKLLYVKLHNVSFL
jgi:hypothetical protein